MADVAPAAKNDAKPWSRVCRSERRVLAASEQRRRHADAAKLTRVAKISHVRARSELLALLRPNRLPNRPRGPGRKRG